MSTGSIRLGGWLALPEPLIAEAAGRAGFDWVGLDLQHGAWDLGAAIRGIQILDLLNVRVLVRVAEENLDLVPRVLDQGASGIVLAMVSGPDAVAATIARALSTGGPTQLRGPALRHASRTRGRFHHPARHLWHDRGARGSRTDH